MSKSLKALNSELAESDRQINILETNGNFIQFEEKLKALNMYPFQSIEPEIFQVNVGKMCNQVCKHCHVDAGPDRKEIMTKETMDLCLKILKQNPSFHTVDLTGGAPELNPNFRYFVEEISKLNLQIIDRCNLTIITANKRFLDLPQFFKKHKIQVVSSLPFYSKRRTDRQRGNGVFEKSIEALQMLNDVGYGKRESGLELNLVFNPNGAFLPPNQDRLEQEFREKLWVDYQIEFNHLFAITNMPISRFLDYLIASKNYEEYMRKLIDSYNPAAVQNVMCRNTLSVSWDGFLYDCDFNQMLDLKIDCKSKHLSNFDFQAIQKREIIVNQHCFGCTAGSGSSCGGEVVQS